MEIKAKFKGKDGSEGYRNGETYKLKFGMADDDTRQGSDHFIRIWAWQSPGRYSNKVLYSSLKSFLNNWQVIG